MDISILNLVLATFATTPNVSTEELFVFIIRFSSIVTLSIPY